MTTARRAAPLLLVLITLTLLTACRQEGAPGAGVLSDSTYVAAMADLQRIHDERIRSPVPPMPLPTGPNASAATPAAQRRRDSVVQARADSIVVADSATRMAVFARYKVTVAELEETARVHATDPARVQRINDAIFRRVAALDNAANLEKARAAKAAAGGPSPAPGKP